MYLVPPMSEEPPPDFCTFVAVHLSALQADAARLVGGGPHADEVYPLVLSDVALHWRRLRLRRRLTGRDETVEYLRRRLAARAEHWREDQIYEIEVQWLRPPEAAPTDGPASVALQKAALLPGTSRVQRRPQAEAAIAWEHAWHRARSHRIARMVAGSTLGFFAVIQIAEHLPG
jgi:hypothetical protein